MNIADKYFIETLIKLQQSENFDREPRAKYRDGTPAFTKFITQQQFKYDISKGEFPINSLRTTAVKGGWYDIEAIYQKQTSIIEEMNPAIHSWWKDFVVEEFWSGDDSGMFLAHSIGQTYGHTVKRYDLMNNLLNGLETNPFGRRHIINLWQEQQMIEDPKALVPCAYETLWTVREKEVLTDYSYSGKSNGSPMYEPIRYIDLTLNQRSMDYLMTSSINPTQYVMFGLGVCGHLTQATGRAHSLGIFTHNIQNLHVYDRHLWAIEELLSRQPIKSNMSIKVKSPKNFYDYTIDDFIIERPAGIQKLSRELELAI